MSSRVSLSDDACMRLLDSLVLISRLAMAPSRNLLVGIDGSTFEIEELIAHTVRILYKPGDLIFLIRIQGPYSTSYDDHLLSRARRTCEDFAVPSVEILVQSDIAKDSHVVDKLCEHALAIRAAFLVIGKNPARGESTISDGLLRRYDAPPLMCVNFAPEITQAGELEC